MMTKMHYRIIGPDCRDQGQTEYEYNHTAACGYVRSNATFNSEKVDCRHCLKSTHMGVEKNEPKLCIKGG